MSNHNWWKQTVPIAAGRLKSRKPEAAGRLASIAANVLASTVAAVLTAALLAAVPLAAASLAVAATPASASAPFSPLASGASGGTLATSHGNGAGTAVSGHGDDLTPWMKRVANTAPCFYLHAFPEPLSTQMMEFGQRVECMNQAPASKQTDANPADVKPAVPERAGWEQTGLDQGGFHTGGGLTEKNGKNEVTAAAAGFQWIHYTVRKGDTLYSISRQFQVPLETIVMSNRIEDPNYIVVGQVLRFPAILPSVSGSKYSDAAGAASDAPFSRIGALHVSKVLNATLTAYTAGYESTGKRPGDPAYGITYSGTKVKEGRTIAVDPDVIPLGSQVYIEGLGIRTAEDIGSAIKGNRIDVYMDDLEKALEFGVQKNVKVYVLQSN